MSFHVFLKRLFYNCWGELEALHLLLMFVLIHLFSAGFIYLFLLVPDEGISIQSLLLSLPEQNSEYVHPLEN